MKISSEIASAAKIVGEERAIELFAKAGFDAWDFSMFEMARYDWATGKIIRTNHPLALDNYAEFAKRLRKVGEDLGIVCNQSHAPFPTRCKEIRDYYKRAIECTAIAGGEICVIHPDNDKSAEENALTYFELLPFAKEHGVKIATENMWNWDNALNQASKAACSHHEDFLKHVEAVNDEYFGACLDIGHAEMRGLNTSAVDCIKTLNNRLIALHIHDNDKHRDKHAIPFSMSIDFDEIVKALKEIDYKGYFTLEADSYLGAFNKDDVEIGVKNLASAAKRLALDFDKKEV